MRVYTSFEQLRELEQPVHWALGFFDGMHRGHRRVIESLPSQGSLRGLVTFAQHPLSLLCPERAPRLIMAEASQRLDYAQLYGVDVVLMLDFTAELAARTPEEFLDLLAESSRVCGVSCGANWHFGRGGIGNGDFLRAYAQEKGWQVCVTSLLEEGERVISSSQIRQHLEAGALGEAVQLLGHPFCLRGEVIYGQQLARQWDFPTANIAITPQTVALPRGVYVVRSVLGGELVRGVANLGLRPTIEEQGKRLLLETHFLDWEGDLYGQILDVELLHFLRAEQRFGSLDELKAQIAADARDARCW